MVLDGCVILLVTFCDVLSLSLFCLIKKKKGVVVFHLGPLNL